MCLYVYLQTLISDVDRRGTVPFQMEIHVWVPLKIKKSVVNNQVSYFCQREYCYKTLVRFTNYLNNAFVLFINSL